MDKRTKELEELRQEAKLAKVEADGYLKDLERFKGELDELTKVHAKTTKKLQKVESVIENVQTINEKNEKLRLIN